VFFARLCVDSVVICVSTDDDFKEMDIGETSQQVQQLQHDFLTNDVLFNQLI